MMHVSKRDALKVIEKIAPDISENDCLILKTFVKNVWVDGDGKSHLHPSRLKPTKNRRCKK